MTANDRQEGGDHYRQEGDKPQHWDLAIIYSWDPFQYQITKYVMRWKDKHETPEKRLMDLKKARHFLDKYIENVAEYDPGTKVVNTPTPKPDLDARQTRVETMKLQVSSTGTQGIVDQNWSCEGYLGSGLNVYKCRHCKQEVTASDVDKAYEVHPNCALAHQYFHQP